MGSSRGILTIVLVILVVSYRKIDAYTGETVWEGFSVSCTSDKENGSSNASVSCYGIRLIRTIVQRLLEETRENGSVNIFDGISLANREMSEMKSEKYRRGYSQNESLFGLLRNRELRIRLPNLLPRNFEAAVKESLPASDQGRGHGGGLGGNKKGGNGMGMIAVMMGKMLAAIGFGALALLTMKALMISALALMLSLILVLKKHSQHKEDDHHHHLVYAQEINPHRRRRSFENLRIDGQINPYRGYESVPFEVQETR